MLAAGGRTLVLAHTLPSTLVPPLAEFPILRASLASLFQPSATAELVPGSSSALVRWSSCLWEVWCTLPRSHRAACNSPEHERKEVHGACKDVGTCCKHVSDKSSAELHE